MSYRYSIDIQLDAPYDEQTIRTILERGRELNIVYYNLDDAEGVMLDAKEGAGLIFKADNEYDLHCLDVKIQGVYAALHFININGNTTVMLTGISYEGLKQFQNDQEDIDIAKYAKILLDLTQDFRIVEMNIEKS